MLVTGCNVTQERFVNALCNMWLQLTRSTPTGTLCPTNYFISWDIDSPSIVQENDPSHSRR